MSSRLHRIASQIKPRLIIIILLLMGGAFLVYLTDGREGKPANAQSETAMQTGLKNFVVQSPKREIPEIVFQLNGEKQVGLAAFRGEVLVLNLWATWCAPCRKEMPQLDALQAHFSGQNVRVIALSLDRGNGDKPKQFLQELGVRHLTWAHDGSYKSARQLGLIGLPTALLIDVDGKEIGRLAGEADWNSAAVHELVEQALID
ncbi:TlpA family protein disulfide reductase [Alphaproteobacteria bacterium]|nr:TlpA family protein disulfide reductase [Alphaproteobacteria bacterium]MDC1241172.1 TlpA family protein disulfide reductase [bacterium]